MGETDWANTRLADLVSPRPAAMALKKEEVPEQGEGARRRPHPTAHTRASEYPSPNI